MGYSYLRYKPQSQTCGYFENQVPANPQKPFVLCTVPAGFRVEMNFEGYRCPLLPSVAGIHDRVVAGGNFWLWAHFGTGAGCANRDRECVFLNRLFTDGHIVREDWNRLRFTGSVELLEEYASRVLAEVFDTWETGIGGDGAEEQSFQGTQEECFHHRFIVESGVRVA